MKLLMKQIITGLVFNLSLVTFVFAEGKHATSPRAKLETRDNWDAEVSQLKEVMITSTTTAAQKMKALTRLAEIEGDDIPKFLAARKVQLDVEIQNRASKESKSIRVAIDRILKVRPENALADSDRPSLENN